MDTLERPAAKSAEEIEALRAALEAAGLDCFVELRILLKCEAIREPYRKRATEIVNSYVRAHKARCYLVASSLTEIPE